MSNKQHNIDVIDESVYEMTYAIDFLAQMWREGGNEITPGWRFALQDLRLSGQPTKALRDFVNSVSDITQSDADDYFIERVITLCSGAKLSAHSGNSLRYTRQYIKHAMIDLFNLSAHLGMSQSEASSVIDGQMQFAKQQYRSMGDA